MRGLFNRVFGELNKSHPDPQVSLNSSFRGSDVISSSSSDQVEPVPLTPLQIKLAGLSPHSEAAKAIKEHLMIPKTETAAAVLDHVKNLKKSAKDYEGLNSIGRFFNRKFGGSQYKAYKDFYELTAAQNQKSDTKAFFKELEGYEKATDNGDAAARNTLSAIDRTLEDSIRQAK